MKRSKTEGEEFSVFCIELSDLNNENKQLKEENKELKKLLGSKRYKTVDFVIDTAYQFLHKISKKQRMLTEDDKKNHKEEKKDNRRVDVGTVDVININFYDWDGKVVFKGGAERYVYDLACLLKEMGYKPRIVQCSNGYFEKKYKGIDVVGIGCGSRNSTREYSAIYDKFCRNAEFVISSPLDLASEIKSVPVIGINHGVNFDGEQNVYNSDCPHLYNDYIDALKNVISCVCVDTNFINFTRIQDYKLSLKERFIPNYYDKKVFKNRGIKDSSEKITFVFPRRLYNARGLDITVEAFNKVLPKYKDKILLNFVGQIDNKEAEKLLNNLMQEFPENVFHYEYTKDEMPKAYRDADVVLIPTRYSEGTSLSCIEGMASGTAIIATNVGGLTNLIIDGFNGRLISPTAESLESAVVQMINRPAERAKLAANGLMVAKEAFSKEKWVDSWREEIKRVKDIIEELAP